ncbi:MAG: fructose-bisphosphatase class II [Acidimicrobiia bacterium]|nr:fructose-bisphosphatase class II [Acidimicrobiia bacterium]
MNIDPRSATAITLSAFPRPREVSVVPSIGSTATSVTGLLPLTPEGVTAAAAIKALGGEIQGLLWARGEEDRALAKAAGIDMNRVLTTDDLVQCDDAFFAATGVTDGDLLRGVRYDAYGATSQSLVMRVRSGTIRTIDTRHRADRIGQYSSVEFR